LCYPLLNIRLLRIFPSPRFPQLVLGKQTNVHKTYPPQNTGGKVSAALPFSQLAFMPVAAGKDDHHIYSVFHMLWWRG
jgi:hypothetical protein